MTSPSPTAAARALADQAATAWERLDAGCAGLLANQCKRHPPYMGCAMDCTDMANALDPEHAEARTAIPPALALLAQLCDQLDAAREERDRLEAEADKIHADRVRLADALRAWRTWAIQRALPWDKRDDQHDDERRASVDERIATLTRERVAFSTDTLARERGTALAEAARLREENERLRGLVVEACDLGERNLRGAATLLRLRDLIATADIADDCAAQLATIRTEALK